MRLKILLILMNTIAFILTALVCQMYLNEINEVDSDCSLMYLVTEDSTTTEQKTRHEKVELLAIEDIEVIEVCNKSGKESYYCPDIPLSAELQQYTYDLCEEYDVDYSIVFAIMWRESRFKPNVCSKSNCKGLMQLMEKYYGQVKGNDLFDPYCNIRVGIELFASKYKHTQDYNKALMCYHSGCGGAHRQFRRGKTSTNYSRSIIERSKLYK